MVGKAAGLLLRAVDDELPSLSTVETSGESGASVNIRSSRVWGLGW